MECAGVAVTRCLRLQHLEIAESLVVLHKSVDAQHTFRLAIDDDITPDDVRGLCVVRGHEGGSVNHTCAIGIYLVIREQCYIVLTSERISIVLNILKHVHFERHVALYVRHELC